MTNVCVPIVVDVSISVCVPINVNAAIDVNVPIRVDVSIAVYVSVDAGVFTQCNTCCYNRIRDRTRGILKTQLHHHRRNTHRCNSRSHSHRRNCHRRNSHRGNSQRKSHSGKLHKIEKSMRRWSAQGQKAMISYRTFLLDN